MKHIVISSLIMTSIFLQSCNTSKPVNYNINENNIEVTKSKVNENFIDKSNIEYTEVIDDSDINARFLYNINDKFDNNNNLFKADNMRNTWYFIDGKGGHDKILTAQGTDSIRGGEGLDIINAGGGNDAVVIIGNTKNRKFNRGDISNAGGSGYNLSILGLTPEGLYENEKSDLMAGEVYDGGDGINSLLIFGDVDLSKVTFQNFYFIRLENSNLTISAEQLKNQNFVITCDTYQINSKENCVIKVVNSDKKNKFIKFDGVIHGFREVYIEKGITLKVDQKIDGVHNEVIVSGEGELKAK